ncbi:hypothetical protein HD553DRAFT_356776 [Filobasidium floriforme]|uniref:uncharacterized protein n=1 Tax=Filobasidium floriforme TaxID=5210 RepID=UPI001E8DB22B|nr:uncharacterized protein HD553DRAFT_356776 [Filobasidium floriforme]KAH8083541.1 hypothetical protein HD553DRAFT_356776 [Filobasidium floriforme]
MAYNDDAASDIPSQRLPDEEIQKPHETIAENDLVMRTVFGFVERPKDLVNCMTASKGFFEIVVPYLYRCCIEYTLEDLKSNKCDLERLKIYKGHVRELTVEEYSVTQVTISAKIQQYKTLEKIVIWPEYRRCSWGGINLTEAYLLGGRRILMKTRVSRTDLDLSNGVGKVITGEDVEWLGICGIEATARIESDTSEAILRQTYSTLSSGAASSLQGLQNLSVLGSDMSLAALETTLRGCPSLKSLACTFDIEAKSTLSDLGELLRIHGSGLHHLHADTTGRDILAVLPHLLICHALTLEGWTKWETLRDGDAPSPTVSPTRELILVPRSSSVENGLLPNPYNWSQRVIGIVPRSCKIYLDETNLRFRESTWCKVVSDCLRPSREPDSRKKTDRPGWTKRDRGTHPL